MGVFYYEMSSGAIRFWSGAEAELILILNQGLFFKFGNTLSVILNGIVDI